MQKVGAHCTELSRESCTDPKTAVELQGWSIARGYQPSLANAAWLAYKRIRPYVRFTDLEYSCWLSAAAKSSQVYLKLENDQITGSFKARGAVNKVLSLAAEQAAAGLVTSSTGNHALAFLYACQQRQCTMAADVGLGTEIFLPCNASQVKVDKLRALGAVLHMHGSDCVDAELQAQRVAQATGRVYVSPYNDMEVVAGQATVAIELLLTLPAGQLDAVFVPVGGGGLIAGIASVIKSVQPGIEVIGCQPAASNVMMQSVAAGHIIEAPSHPTLSDATAGGIEPEALTLQPCMELVDHWVAVEENEIAECMAAMLKHHNKRVEGAAACAMAAFKQLAPRFAGKHVVIVCCGGNVSTDTLQHALSQVTPKDADQ